LLHWHCVMLFHLMAESPESLLQKVLFDSNS
jgi:hypothetical protein